MNGSKIVYYTNIYLKYRTLDPLSPPFLSEFIGHCYIPLESSWESPFQKIKIKFIITSYKNYENISIKLNMFK